jgi:hypothetical protein
MEMGLEGDVAEIGALNGEFPSITHKTIQKLNIDDN